MSRRRGPSRGALAATGAGVAAVAAGAEALRRRRREPVDDAGHAAAPEAIRTWHCACGQEFRTTGAGRHQVHWLAGADIGDPVIGDACPSCGRPLPVGVGENGPAAGH